MIARNDHKHTELGGEYATIEEELFLKEDLPDLNTDNLKGIFYISIRLIYMILYIIWTMSALRIMQAHTFYESISDIFEKKAMNKEASTYSTITSREDVDAFFANVIIYNVCSMFQL